ncbi:hypothetical protein ACFY1B_40130 [Streptomyces mirabilis]|uniref:hypothetical protein n=1 Tax=Streptomyces mirabilis TaxID=68239 RepID=UPI00367EECB7
MRSRRMSPVSGPVREREERALTDSELVCLDLAQGLLGHRSGARWLLFARKYLTGMFPCLPQQSG